MKTLLGAEGDFLGEFEKFNEEYTSKQFNFLNTVKSALNSFPETSRKPFNMNLPKS